MEEETFITFGEKYFELATWSIAILLIIDLILAGIAIVKYLFS